MTDQNDLEAMPVDIDEPGCPYACKPNDFDFCRYCGRDMKEES